MEPVPFIQAGAVGVSLDPWNNSDDSVGRNSSSRSSNPLAALREGGTVDNREATVIAGIPLNSDTPSLLSKFANATYAEPAYASVVSDDGGGDDFIEPDSFYNHLLGEE